MRLLALLLLLSPAACTRNNNEVLDDRAAAATEDPRPDFDEILASGKPPRLVEGPREYRLPMQRGRLPTVRGRINGVDMSLILDTGTSITVLSGPAVRKTNAYFPERRSVGMLTPGYNMPHKVGVFESLEIGPYRFGPSVTSAALQERRRAFGLFGANYAIVGSSVLSHFAVTFDYGRREVRLVRHGRPPIADVLTTDVVVNGKLLRLLVDSGANRVVLEPMVALKLGLIDPDDASRLLAKGDRANNAPELRVTLKKVTIAGRTFENVSGLVIHTFPERDGARSPHGLLGLGAFGDVAWTLDYGAPRLRLEDRGG